MNRFTRMAAFVAATWTAAAAADSTDARCDIYPRGEDHTDKMIACTFSQRQGYVTITRADGVTHDLSPVGDVPGNYRDQNGRAVYRQDGGIGDQGMIFRLPDESVFVYWDTAALKPPSDKDNPTAPFTTADYNATTLLRCRAAGSEEFGNCPAGILRMEGEPGLRRGQKPAGRAVHHQLHDRLRQCHQPRGKSRTQGRHLDGDSRKWRGLRSAAGRH